VRQYDPVKLAQREARPVTPADLDRIRRTVVELASKGNVAEAARQLSAASLSVQGDPDFDLISAAVRAADGEGGAAAQLVKNAGMIECTAAGLGTVLSILAGLIRAPSASGSAMLLRSLQQVLWAKGAARLRALHGELARRVESGRLAGREMEGVIDEVETLVGAFGDVQASPHARVAAQSMAGAVANLERYRRFWWLSNAWLVPAAGTALLLAARFLLGEPGFVEGVFLTVVLGGCLAGYLLFGAIRDFRRRVLARALKSADDALQRLGMA
jgi:hypothetical protein